MNAKNANAILESANRAIELILRRDIAAGYGTDEDPAPKWLQAVSQINKEMASVKPVVPYATEIPQLLVAVDVFWPKNHDWPDWQSICNPDVATLEKHEWWPKAIGVKGNGVEGQSSKSVLGKCKAVEVTVKEGEAEQEEDVMEIDEDARAEARRKEKIDRKKKAQDVNPHNNSEDVERGRPTRRRRMHDEDKHPKCLDDAKEGAEWKDDVQRKRKAQDDVSGSNDNPEYGRPRRRRGLPSQGDDTQLPTPKSILLPVKSTLATSSKKGTAAPNGDLYDKPCSECAKKANPRCYRPVDGDGTACLPCKTGKRRCDYSHNYKLRARSAVRAQSRARSKTPAPSKPPPPSLMANTKEQSQSGHSSKKLIPEVVITSKPIKKPAPNRKQRPSPPPIAGPSRNRSKSVNRSSPVRPRSVPPATAATNPTARALTPGRPYSLTGVPMATKEEFDIFKEELHGLRQEMAQMWEEWDNGVKALLRWDQDYQLLQAELRAVVAECSSLQEEIRNLRIGYGSMGRVVEGMRRQVSGTSKDLTGQLVLPFQLPFMAPGPSRVSSPGSPRIPMANAATTSPSRTTQTTPPATPETGALSTLHSPSQTFSHFSASPCASPCPATPVLCTTTLVDPAEGFSLTPPAAIDQSASQSRALSPSRLQLNRLPSPSRLSLVQLPSHSKLQLVRLPSPSRLQLVRLPSRPSAT